MNFGPVILARSLSKAGVTDKHGRSWSYHPRSDRHSKVACWGAIFDLLIECPLVRHHAENRRIAFGINHEMTDFKLDRRKNLDLVICTPAARSSAEATTFASLVERYGVVLSPIEAAELAKLPSLEVAPVGSVLIALEAKACMTAHQRALPRLYDELNSSHQTVHGANDKAIAAGLVMINAAERFISPGPNGSSVQNRHNQPKSVQITLDKVRQLPRRSGPGEAGFDAVGVVVVDCKNDGSKVTLATPSPPEGSVLNYAGAIERMAHSYATRFDKI